MATRLFQVARLDLKVRLHNTKLIEAPRILRWSQKLSWPLIVEVEIGRVVLIDKRSDCSCLPQFGWCGPAHIRVSVNCPLVERLIRLNGWLRNSCRQLITPLDIEGIGQHGEDRNIARMPRTRTSIVVLPPFHPPLPPLRVKPLDRHPRP